MPTFNSYFYHRQHRLKHKCLPLDTLYLIQNEWKIRSTWRISQITLEYVLVLDPLIYYRSKSVCHFHFRPKSTSKVYLYWTLMSVRSWSFSQNQLQGNCCILWIDITPGPQKVPKLYFQSYFFIFCHWHLRISIFC